QHKRVILFSKEGKEQYKSIYVERSNRLKIVDFSQGLLFNETLHGAEVVQDEKQTETAQKEKGTQQEKAAPIDKQPYVTKESKTEKKQYRSIYVERSNRVKIGDFSQGLLFNETLHGAEVVQDEKQTEIA